MLIFHNNAPNESHFVLILKAYFSLELITAQTHYFIFMYIVAYRMTLL